MRTPRTRRPRKAPAKAQAKARGLRIRCEGTATPQELRDMLLDAVIRIEELGISHASGINLYITPVTPDGTPLTPVKGGQPVRSITIAPYRSAADEHGL